MGIQMSPNCEDGGIYCDILEFIENNFFTLDIIQDHVAPAAYYRDTYRKARYEAYLKHSQYLPYINNEKNHTKMEQYKQRFSSLNAVQLIYFEEDDVVYPRESEKFQELNSTKQLVPLTETRFWKEDWIGFR